MSLTAYSDWFKTDERFDKAKQSKDLESVWDEYFNTYHNTEISKSIASDLKVFKKFQESEIYVANKLIVTKSVYDEYFYDFYGRNSLSGLYTSSIQKESFDWLTRCYISPSVTSSVVYASIYGSLFNYKLVSESFDKEEYRLFDIAYGHYAGSGSSTGASILYDDATQTYDFSYPSKAVYFSLKNNTYGPIIKNTEKVKLFATGSVDSLFAINVGNHYMYDGIANNGSFELKLAKMNGSSSINNLQALTGIHLYKTNYNPALAPELVRSLYYDRTIHSFVELSKTATQISTPKEFDYIVSGSLIDGVHYKNGAPDFYGRIYYNSGIVLLDADKLSTLLNLNLQTGSNSISNNSMRLYKSVSASLATRAFLYDGNSFFLDQENSAITTPRFDIKQEIDSTFYRCIIRTDEFNYSTHPSYYDGKSGDLRIKAFYSGSSDFYVRPQSYITTIGLYDSGYNLLAVAKLSKPQRKSFNNSIIINVRLDY